jgi:hypothetical protein
MRQLLLKELMSFGLVFTQRCLLVVAALLYRPQMVSATGFTKHIPRLKKNKNDFHTIKLPWDVHPERDEDWFDKETRNMSRREIAQELECNFNASGETVIHGDDLKRIVDSLTEPSYKTGFDRNYWIWEEPQDHKAIFVSC